MNEKNPDLKHLKELSEFIDKNDHFLVCGHVGADGDAIAASLGIVELLAQRDKTFNLIFNDDPVDPRFKYLNRFAAIKSTYDVKEPVLEAAIICDTPSSDRMGTAAELLTMPKENIFRIDHHPGEDQFAGHNWEDTARSSTAIMVYHLLCHEDVIWTKELADTILTGIIYDTGRFGYRNTHPEDLHAAAEMLKQGSSIEQISQSIFFNYRLQAIQVFGYGLVNAQVYDEGRLAVIFVNNEHMNYVTTHEIEELSTYAASVKDALIGAFIREEGPGFFKLSLRSRSNVRVDGIAKSMGGGGHKQAAGCRMKGTYQEVVDKLMKEFKKAFKEANAS